MRKRLKKKLLKQQVEVVREAMRNNLQQFVGETRAEGIAFVKSSKITINAYEVDS